MLTGQRDLDALREKLRAWLAARAPGGGDVAVTSLKKPSAGLSNETYLFEVDWRRGDRAGAEPLVLRVQPQDFQVFPDYDLAVQYRILQRLAATDVPVPRVRWYEDRPGPLGGPFYVMNRVEGAIPSEVPPYHAFGLCFDATPERRARMWWSGIEAMARIHALDWSALGLDFLGAPGPGEGALDRQLAYYERYLGWACPDLSRQPVLTRALSWLKDNRVPAARVSLCWGDSRLPNLMFRDDAVAAVLDWEMAHLGDPEADLAWWLFHDWAASAGYGFARLEGLPSREETIERYARITGTPVRHAFYYEVWAAFRFGVIMARIAERLKEIGAPVPTPDFESNNVATQALARLLELPAPGAAAVGATADGRPARVQMRLTGPGGSEWYVVAAGAKATRHEGRIGDPDVVLTAAASDWNAIQSGELGRTEAFFGGKLRIDGDVNLLMQLEAAIAKLSKG